jgi:uncharacterized membrane protein YdbT with pleckstrin-like domain
MEEWVSEKFRSATARWLFGTANGLVTLALFPVGVGIAIAAVVWVVNRFTVYTLTSQRLIIEEGVIFKSVDEVELHRVKDVRLSFSLLNQIAGIGRIEIRSSDPSTPGDQVLHLPHLRDAKRLREVLRKLVEAARRERGVREIDTSITSEEA